VTRAGLVAAWRRVRQGLGATSTLGALALVVALVPGLAEAAQLDRARAWAEPWRVVTAHLSHFTPSHLALDVIVLFALGFACESRWPRRTRIGLAAAMLACSAAFWFGAPELATYRGLSGLDAMLFALLAARLHVERAFRGRWTRALPSLALAGFLAKIAFELIAGVAPFAGGEGVFVPVPLAHLAGAAVGLAAALARRPTLVGSRDGDEKLGRALRRGEHPVGHR